MSKYNQIYLYGHDRKKFFSLEEAQKYMETKKMRVGKYIILQIGSINTIQNRILNEDKVKQKEYAHITHKMYDAYLYNGIVTACDIKQARQTKIKIWGNSHLIPLSKGKIPISYWKIYKNIEELFLNDEVLKKTPLKDIIPTNETLVSEAL